MYGETNLDPTPFPKPSLYARTHNLNVSKVAEALWCRLSEIQNYGHDRESDGEAKSPFPRLPDGRDAIGLNPNIRWKPKARFLCEREGDRDSETT
eukprot:938129-Amorphochlora_amoeboformis.AAC.1